MNGSLFKGITRKVFISLIVLIIYRIGSFIPIPNTENSSTPISIMWSGLKPYLISALIMTILAIAIPFIEKLIKSKSDRNQD